MNTENGITSSGTTNLEWLKPLEECDGICGQYATLTVRDSRGYEIAVTCLNCVPVFQRTFEDKDGNQFNP